VLEWPNANTALGLLAFAACMKEIFSTGSVNGA